MSIPESNLPASKAQIFPCTIHGVYCGIYRCKNKADWVIGRPDGPITVKTRFYICDDCLQSIASQFLEIQAGDPDPEEASDEEAELPVAARHRPKPLQKPRLRRS